MKKMNFQLELFWSEGWYDSKSVFGSLRMPFHNKNLLKENSRWQGPPVHVVVSRRPKTLRCVRDFRINRQDRLVSLSNRDAKQKLEGNLFRVSHFITLENKSHTTAGTQIKQLINSSSDLRVNSTDRIWNLVLKEKSLKLTLLDSFCLAFIAMNFSSHAAAWALRTTLTKLPFCWGQKQKSTMLIKKWQKNKQRTTT